MAACSRDVQDQVSWSEDVDLNSVLMLAHWVWLLQEEGLEILRVGEEVPQF